MESEVVENGTKDTGKDAGGMKDAEEKENEKNRANVSEDVKDSELKPVTDLDQEIATESENKKMDMNGISSGDTNNQEKTDKVENNQNGQEDQTSDENTEKTKSKPKTKKNKKNIFISYSPDAGFVERKFVVETVRQLKENSLAEDLWFDKDEKNTDSPCWFSLRMEAVERCKAAVVILSDSFFMCPVSVYEGRTLLERQKADPKSVKIFLVLLSPLEETEIPKQYFHLLDNMVDLTTVHAKKSVPEKTSVVVGAIMVELEKFATALVPSSPATPPYAEYNGEYKKKKICQWSANDLQEWLFVLGIKEFYRQNLAENMVDGFLLMSLTDQDMVHQLRIDSRVVRKKIMQQILLTLDKEHKLADNWHLRSRTQRPRPNMVYFVYDPADVKLAQNMKQDLMKKNIQVLHHQKLGQSKEEFLQINGPTIAVASHVLVLMTEKATSSPFVFHEILFSDWLGKKLVTAMFKNTWSSLRASMKAVLGECPAVDFETKLYTESIDVLEHHIKPLKTVPGVVLEQAYLNKMADGLKPFSVLVNAPDGPIEWEAEKREFKVFISYQWDMQSKVEDVRHLLESSGFICWADISPTMQRGYSSMSSRSLGANSVSSSVVVDTGNETLQSQIQRNMRAASVVLCCITPKYMQSDNCVKDLTLAETLHKPIVPLMLRFSPWPPEGAPSQVRKIMSRLSHIDLSNEKLYKQNLPLVLDRVKRVVSLK